MRTHGVSAPAVMARIWVACCVLMLTLAPAPAWAGPATRVRQGTPSAAIRNAIAVTNAIVPATANDLALAMGIAPADLVSANIGTSDPLGVGVGNSPLGRFFPRQGGTFAILSTGHAASAELPNSSGSTSDVLTGLNNSQGNDMVQLTLVLTPPPGAQCLGFDYAFYSEEFPEFVGSMFNDFFLAELGSSTFTINPDSTVTAPHNFAFDPAGHIMSINSAFGVTAFTESTYDGATPVLRAVAPVAGLPTVTVVLTISDLGDSIYDSAVFLDNFAWSFTPGCSSGTVLGQSILSPQSGPITLGETFDLTLFTTQPPVGATVLINGANVTPSLISCVFGSRQDLPGNTIRCPGVSGGLLQGALGPGPYTVQVSFNLSGGGSESEIGTYEILRFDTPAQLARRILLLPSSGLVATTQHFDLVVALSPDGVLTGVAGASATFDNIDITAPLVACLTAHPIETVGSGPGIALRCPLSGGLLGPGIHVLAFSLSFNDATTASDSVVWQVIPVSE